MTEALKLSIDSSGAKQGADAFNASVKGMDTALGNFDRSSAKVIDNLNSRVGKINFQSFSRGLASINGAVNGTTVSNLARLSSVMGQMRVPTATQANNLRSFASAVNSIRVPNIQGLSPLLGAISRFNPPNAATVSNVRAFGQAISQIGSISTGGGAAALHTMSVEMNNLATATLRAASAYRQLQAAQNRVSSNPAAQGGRQPFVGRNPNYGARPGYGNPTVAARGPYDGIFSGQTRATAELRGMENVVNPAYQGASVLRTAVGAITLGSFVKEIYSAGKELTQVTHMMEVMSSGAEQTAAWMKKTSDIAEHFGLNLTEVRKGFSSFVISSMQSGFTENQAIATFTNLSSAIRALGLDSEKSGRLFHAFESAVSIGTITAGVLHNQIARAIPGATPILARINYNEKNKLPLSNMLDVPTMLRAEQELTKDTRQRALTPQALIKFAEELARLKEKGLPTAVHSAQAEEERMRSQWTKTKESMAGTMDPNIIKLWQGLTNIMKNDDIGSMFQTMATGISSALDKLRVGLLFMSRHMPEIIMVFKAFLALGTAEVLLRLGGAFSSVGNLAAMMVAPIGRATASMRGLVTATGTMMAMSARSVGAGIAGTATAFVARSTPIANTAALAAVNASTAASFATMRTAGVSAFTALGAAASAAARIIYGAFAIGAVGAFGILYAAWDNMDAKGYTVGEKFGASMEAAGERALKVANGIRNDVVDAFNILTGSSSSSTESWKGDMGDWARVTIMAVGMVISAFTSLAEVLAAVLGGIVRVVSNPMVLGALSGAAVGSRVGLWGAIGLGLAGAGTGAAASGGVAENQASINSSIAEMLGKLGDSATRSADSIQAIIRGADLPDLENRMNLRRDEKARMGVNGEVYGPVPRPNIENVTTSTDPAPFRMPGHGAGGGGGNAMPAAWDALRTSVSGYDKVIIELDKDMRTLAWAIANGKTTNEEAARIQDSIKDKLLATLGVADPMIKATERMRMAVGSLNALEQRHIITMEEKKKYLQTIATLYEKAAHPVDYFLKQQGEEVKLLMMTNKQREVEAKLLEEVKKMRESGREPTTDEVAQMRAAITTAQKMKEFSADQEHGLSNWANSFRSLYTELAKFEEKMATDMSNSIADFITTGKGGFTEMMQSWYKDIMRLVTRDVFRQLLGVMGLGEMGGDKTGKSLLGGALGLASPQQNMQATLASGGLALANAGASPDIVAAYLRGDTSVVGGAAMNAINAAGLQASGGVSAIAPLRGKNAAGAALTGAGIRPSGVTGSTGSSGMPLPPLPPGLLPSSGGSSSTTTEDISGLWRFPEPAAIDSGYANMNLTSLSTDPPTIPTADVFAPTVQPSDFVGPGFQYPETNVNLDMPLPPIPPMPLPPVPPGYEANGASLFGKSGTYGNFSTLMSPGIAPNDHGMAIASKVFGAISGGMGGGSGGGSFLTGNASAGGGGGIASMLFGKSANNMFGLTDPQGAFMQNGGLLGYITGSASKGGYGLFSDIGSLFGGGASASAPALGSGLSALIDSSGTMTSSLATDAVSSGGLFSGIGDWLSTLFSGLFEEGGMTGAAVKMANVPYSAFQNAPHYASGTTNTSFSGGGMPAIVHPNEAIIPLSRGRSIPVDLGNGDKYGGGGGKPTVVMNINTPNADSFRHSQSQIMKDAGLGLTRHMRRN